MNKAIETEIVEKLNVIIIDLDPDVTFRTMYGGTVIELKKNDPKSRVGGIYTYTDYVSLELSNGVSLSDPKRVLEGKGKLRRHVKLRGLDDIKKKYCGELLRQAILVA